MRLLHLGPESRVRANPGTRKRVSNRHRAAPEILGLDHVYLSVADFARSEVFYDRVMKRLGFKKGTFPIGGEPHCHYFNRNLQISIRPARSAGSRHDSYAPGLHHLCFRVANNAAVDEVARLLRPLGIEMEGPRLWPEYAPDYYAVFFSDPDGMRFEVMNYRKGRKTVRRVWNELEGFVNPMGRLQRKRAKAARG
jgi:glyoxylase I family protein